jgi:vesicle coat complex subunit
MLKKLLLIFWEVVPKTDSEGKLMQEMILVCDAYRKDLQHPNEFIRGATLRFLCKLKVNLKSLFFLFPFVSTGIMETVPRSR